MSGRREMPSEGAFSESVLIVVSYAIIRSLLMKPVKHFTKNPKEIDNEALNCMYLLLSITNTLHEVLMVVIVFACASSFCAACSLCGGEPRTAMAIDFPLF